MMRDTFHPAIRRAGTNNVNICININKSNSDFDNIAYLHDKVTSLSSDLNLLKSNVSDLTSIEAFEQKLNQYFDLTEREKIKTLINDQTYETLMQYAAQYNEFNSLLEEGAKVKYKETMVYLNEFSELSSSIITAQIEGESIVLNDFTNSDNDEDTIYKIPIQGFVIGVELYSSSENDSKTETFAGIKTSYDASENLSYVFLTPDDYRIVYERGPNNKLKIHSLIIS